MLRDVCDAELTPHARKQSSCSAAASNGTWGASSSGGSGPEGTPTERVAEAIGEIHPIDSRGVEVISEPQESGLGVTGGEAESGHVRFLAPWIRRISDPVDANGLRPRPTRISEITPIPVDWVAWRRVWYLEQLERPHRRVAHEQTARLRPTSVRRH